MELRRAYSVLVWMQPNHAKSIATGMLAGQGQTFRQYPLVDSENVYAAW